MPQNSIQLRSNKTRSHNGESQKTNDQKTKRHDVKQIVSSQHQKFTKKIIEQLKAEMSQLNKIYQVASLQAKKSYLNYQYWKNENNEYESDFHYKSYQSWSDKSRRLDEKILVKLGAVRKFRMSLKEVDFQTFLDIKAEEQMKYGPIDDEE